MSTLFNAGWQRRPGERKMKHLNRFTYPHPYNQTYFITLFSTAFRGVCHTAIIQRLIRIGVWR